MQLGEKPVEVFNMTRPADPVAFVGAVVSVVLLGMFLVALPKLAAAAGSFGDDSGGRGEPFEYVEARLLKWGEIKDKEALPDRIVPALPTAPEETLPLDRNENKAEPPAKPKKPARQRGAVTDEKLRQVFDKARAFAEIQDDFVPEGHPDGVPDGDVTDPALASMGATYGRRITRLIQERLMVPTLISEAQKNKLKAKIHLKFDIDMTIVSFKFIKKSGNALYDDAIQNAVDKVRIEVRNLPAPPEAIAPRVFGGGIVINLRGQDSPYE